MTETPTAQEQASTETGKRFTNLENLPEPIVRAVTRDHYDKGGPHVDFSCTGLLEPPRARAIKKQHRDEIVEDVADRLWALCGQVGHGILERAGSDSIVERRFFAKVATFMISGQADLIVTGNTAELIDYKFCSIWTVKEGVKTEWTQQVNILRFLALWDDNPVEITKASIVAIFRDWSKAKARREKDYPQSQVKVLPVELWPVDKTEQFICNRIAAHITAESWLPLCTDEERWRTPEKWAIKKKGNKRAMKLFDTAEEAIERRELECGLNQRDDFEIEHRPGESKRCEFYCLAAPWCSQFKKEKAK